MKPIIWMGSTKAEVREFPVSVRQEAGFELYLVQNGQDPSDWKPVASVGVGVKEIRIHERNEYRVMYVAKFSDAVYVLHAFVKKTQQTSRIDVEIARNRYKSVVASRRRQT